MTSIVKSLIDWLTFGPFKGHRTQILTFALFALGGAQAAGYLTGPNAVFIDQATYTGIVAILAGAIGKTAADHK